MILFENYNKTKIDNRVYDTVMLADIVELNKEKYFILSGYLFNNTESKEEARLDEEYKNDTFFKRNLEDDQSDIDAYYLIYNIEKQTIVNNKKQFIQENVLNKNIRLDRTKCEEVTIGGEKAYKIKINNSQYVFIDVKDNNSSYLILKEIGNRWYPEKMIQFNKDKNKAEISEDIKYLQDMVDEIEDNKFTQKGISIVKVLNNIKNEIKGAENLN